MLRKTVTGSFGSMVSSLNTGHLSDAVVRRSKRMLLDTLGVGLIGTRTPVFNTILRYCERHTSLERSCVWGRPGVFLPAQYAAFANGVAVHSMDFDDTWHPATHPSGVVLPALLALADTLPTRPSGLELLLAFNVGLEVQGRLMRFSQEAHSIPKRFHPPAVVGVMGSAAACAKLLGLSPGQCVAALAIASSSAGAPLANAATQTKPLHVANAARRGLEASQLAMLGLEGNSHILDATSGFGVFYQDYSPCEAVEVSPTTPHRWLLEEQDIAIKRFPAHLGMHWVADAAMSARTMLLADKGADVDLSQVRRVRLRVPASKYIDCPLPESEHEARHSFQFNCSSALLDGRVTVDSFSSRMMARPALRDLMRKVTLENPRDNPPSFDQMYCEVVVETQLGETYTARCNTFYGHWRLPLSKEDLQRKFRENASTVLCSDAVDEIIRAVDRLETVSDCTVLGSYLHHGQSGPEKLVHVSDSV